MAADGVDCLKVQLVHGSKKHNIELKLPQNEAGDVLTVGHLAKCVAEVTDVPEESQRLIFKGRSLMNKGECLSKLGIRQGSKIMLLGRKSSLQEGEDMQKIKDLCKGLKLESQKLTVIINKIETIDEGLVTDRKEREALLQSLNKELLGSSESFMKMLESIDALHVRDQDGRAKRKALVHEIQGLLGKCDLLSQDMADKLQKTGS